MKKSFVILFVFVFVLGLTGCGSKVDQSEYDTVCAERDALQAELNTIQIKMEEVQKECNQRVEERNALQAELEEMQSRVEEKIWVKISGGFVATVHGIIPDYSISEDIPMMAVVSTFQDSPFVIRVGELAEKLEAGETYVFEINEQEHQMTRVEYDKGAPSADVAAEMYSLSVSSASPAGEEDWGLNPDHKITFELVE